MFEFVIAKDDESNASKEVFDLKYLKLSNIKFVYNDALNIGESNKFALIVSMVTSIYYFKLFHTWNRKGWRNYYY